jgi:hypothetical protein
MRLFCRQSRVTCRRGLFLIETRHRNRGSEIMAEATPSTPGVDAQPSIARAKMILTELACAAQAAALSAVDEQRTRAAAQVAGAAEAVRSAARSFERSQSPTAARYADCAARQIEALAEAVRARHWTELAVDVEQAARRRPVLFVAGAVALGFIAGRFWAASRRIEPSAASVARATETTVAAAVSSATGNGRLTDWPPPSQAQELP